MSGLIIVLDPDEPAPPYEQIREQIAAIIAAGHLAEGSTLPSVRQLAGDLRIAPNTVVRAYAELQREGWISPVSRRGFQVAGGAATRGSEERTRQLERAVSRLAQTAQRLGVDAREVHAAVDRLYASDPLGADELQASP